MNQMLPSGPVVIAQVLLPGELLVVGKSVMPEIPDSRQRSSSPSIRKRARNRSREGLLGAGNGAGAPDA